MWRQFVVFLLQFHALCASLWNGSG